MLKKIMCLVLCAAMLVSVALFTACGDYEEPEDKGTVPTTLSIVGITEESTKEEDIRAVEAAINEITKARYKIAINLTLVTMDEYYDLIDERVKTANYYKNVDAAILNYNNYMKQKTESAAAAIQSSKNSKKKWVKTIQTVEAETLSTRPVYTAEETTVYPDGTIETVYPEAASPIDIVMISGREMYDKFDEMDLLSSVKSSLSTNPKLKQYIYPTFFTELENVTGDVKAIPNNNLLANYKYLVVNKELADKYEYNISAFSDYTDLSEFLEKVKAGESDVVPFAEKPDALGIYYAFSEDIAIGTYFNPIHGYDAEEGTSFTVSNLFDVPQYTNYLKTMETFTEKGYFDGSSDKFAAKVITGDASVEALYGGDDGDYYVKVIQNPFVNEEILFRGMLAVTNYASNAERALTIIEMINTDSQVKNLLQYGIEKKNYTVNADGTITRLNHDYMMDNNLTGNVYMGYPEEGMSADTWNYVKQTNLDSSAAPFLIYDVTDAKVDALMDSIIKRAIMNEALAPQNIDYTTYVEAQGTADGEKYHRAFRRNNEEFFKKKLQEAGVKANSVKSVFDNLTHKVYTVEWYENTYVDYVKAEKFSNISTEKGIDALIKKEIASVVGYVYSKDENKTNSFEALRENAQDYYSNIEHLRIMTKLTIFKDMSEEELAKYDNLSNTDFEQAVFDYVKQNYIEENNITDETYDKLIKDFISSGLTQTDNLTKKTYTVSWDLYQETKASAEVFQNAAAKLKDSYSELLLSKYSQKQIDAMDALELCDAVHTLLYNNYLSENETTKKYFEDELKDIIAEPTGLSYMDMVAKRADTITYTGYMNKIRSKYKSVIVAKYSLEEFKAGTDAISNDEVITTILDYLIEERTGIYKEMRGVMGMSESEYKSAAADMKNFKSYARKMRDNAYYTLATEYTSAEIDAFNLNDVDNIVYDIMSRTGFYTNVMAQYVGKELGGRSGYMNAKSKSVKYTEAMNKLIARYESEFKAAGYTMTEIRSMNPEDVEDIVYNLLHEKYTAQFTSVNTLLKSACAEYIAKLATTTDVGALCEEASTGLNGNAIFRSVVETLASEVKTKIEELSKDSSK